MDIPKAGTKRDQLVHDIRQLIISGELERGSRVRQDDVARRFSLSITPVREALRQLEAEGLLVSEPHRGVRVAEIDLDAIKGTYIMRRLVEPYVMQKAARRVARRDLERAADLNAQMEIAAKEEDLRASRELNHQFHRMFFERCGIPSLTRGIQNLWPAFPMFQALPGRTLESIAEHDVILAAMETGDLAAVHRATEVHITRSYQALGLFLTGQEEVPDPFEIDID